jgi:hypothetical protein
MKLVNNTVIYVGKTGRTFYTRNKEYIQAIRNNKANSGYSIYIVSTGPAYGSIYN